MNYARIEKSARLQKLYAFLADGKPHTTKEIGDVTDIEAVGSAIGELRRNGFRIVCRQTRGGHDSRVFEYQLIVN